MKQKGEVKLTSISESARSIANGYEQIKCAVILPDKYFRRKRVVNNAMPELHLDSKLFVYFLSTN